MTDRGTVTARSVVLGTNAYTDDLWPGLRKTDLFDDRDLAPTTDMRSLFKSVLGDHLSLPDALLNNTVFPDSAAARPLKDLIRS